MHHPQPAQQTPSSDRELLVLFSLESLHRRQAVQVLHTRREHSVGEVEVHMSSGLPHPTRLCLTKRRAGVVIRAIMLGKGSSCQGHSGYSIVFDTTAGRHSAFSVEASTSLVVGLLRPKSARAVNIDPRRRDLSNTSQ